ncbi:GntR family transcriptional regulator [Actinomycetospora sp. NBRC 106378]|uniref:GntR family transcriptional regulator n=1 Tax=Actinomycetospora sp. NBRC 106378 TaxID=3032208 RepID=UPI0024A50538|nr:GntR family transcriptional regulator [Actinomycetospora sp. NBRC 106378]GLZ55105.1 GntR family transcriptional regulator [Actinomycetospora sp. NBRC 106378]
MKDPSELIDVDPSSPVAPYEQVRASVTELVRTGALPAHTRLPAVRRLAVDLGLAANTVARAYRELEAAGVVETRGRLGTFVVESSGGPDEAREAARAFAGRMRELGVTPERALDLARAALTA